MPLRWPPTAHQLGGFGPRWLWGLPAALVLLIGGFAWGEWCGWPWLAGPLQRQLSERLGRELRLLPGDINNPALRVSLWRGLRLQAGHLQIDAPAGPGERPTLEANAVELRLRYRDLWDWRGRGTLEIASLRAASLQADLWRNAEGQASWQLRPAAVAASSPGEAPPAPLLRLQHLALDQGRVLLRDQTLGLDTRIEFSIGERGMQARAEGSYRDKALQARLSSPVALPWIADSGEALPVTLALRAGRSSLDFDGRLRGLADLRDLQGRYKISGPSLAAIGDPLGITLPSTAAFTAQGSLIHDAGGLWRAEVERALLGRSQLRGSFVYTRGGARPKLSGTLGGETLWFADLGPAIGAPPAAAPKPAGAKLIPDRQFDLPSLRHMDADVEVALQRVDLGSAFAEPLTPARARLLLQDGVLRLEQLDLRTARGRIFGRISLDGRAARALWDADLGWSGLRLEQWIRQARPPGRPPYLSGRLDGRLQLRGSGRSTAELLATAQGRATATMPEGKLSHLAVEAAGIDLAQALGVWLRGDDALPLRCAVADLRIERGLVRPRALVVDTSDSVLWAEGQLSLATERLDLRLQVAPKDFSPLTLRTPIRVEGSFSAPQLALEPRPLARKLVPAVLLAALNPIAGLLPLIDAGAAGKAQQQSCLQLLTRARKL